MNSTLHEILNNERVNKKLHYLFSPAYYENIRPILRKMKLKHMVKFAKTPWGRPFPAEGLLRCANLMISRREAGELISIPIWKDLPEEQAEEAENVVLIPFLLKDKKDAPCVILCPGGGYTRVACHNEGIPVAEELNRRGYQAFLLNYRVYPSLYPAPEQDLVRAIRFVRANREKLGVDPENVMIMGFSAGGHLCACVGALYDHIEDPTHRYDHISARPDKICLSYPVISFMEDCHEGSLIHHLGENATEEKKKTLSAEMLTSRDYPPTFLWACQDDDVVPVSNTERMAASLKNKKAPYEMKLYPEGGHGLGLAEGTGAQGWLDEMESFFTSIRRLPKTI